MSLQAKLILMTIASFIAVVISVFSTHHTGDYQMGWFTPTESVIPTIVAFHLLVIAFIVIEAYDHRTKRIEGRHTKAVTIRAIAAFVIAVYFVWELDPLKIGAVFLYQVGLFAVAFDPLREWFNSKHTGDKFEFFSLGNQSTLDKRWNKRRVLAFVRDVVFLIGTIILLTYVY